MTQISARDFMVKDLITIAPDADVIDAVGVLLTHGISGAPVVDSDGRYLGVFSEKCSMQVLLDAAYEQLPVRDVRSYMDVEAQTIGPETHLLSVAQVFLLTPAQALAGARERQAHRAGEPPRRARLLDGTDRAGGKRFARDDARQLQRVVRGGRSAAGLAGRSN